MKKLILLCSALMFVAAIAVTASVMTQSENDALLLANLEALTGDEEYTGYGYDIQRTCTITMDGMEPIDGVYVVCVENAGWMTTCAGGCIDSIEEEIDR